MLTYNGEEGTPYSFCPHKCGQCSSQEIGSNTGSNGMEETGTESSTESNTGSNEISESTNGSGGTSKNNYRNGNLFSELCELHDLAYIKRFYFKPVLDESVRTKLNWASNLEEELH